MMDARDIYLVYEDADPGYIVFAQSAKAFESKKDADDYIRERKVNPYVHSLWCQKVQMTPKQYEPQRRCC